MDLLFIMQGIVYPVMVSLLLAITTPYAAVVGILPILGKNCHLDVLKEYPNRQNYRKKEVWI